MGVKSAYIAYIAFWQCFFAPRPRTTFLQTELKNIARNCPQLPAHKKVSTH